VNFKEIVKYITAQGCRVRIYKNLKKIHGNTGTFHLANKGPLISLATKGSPKKKRIEYLLHEFGHFLQWRNGYMEVLDSICDSYTLWDEWIAGDVELTDLEWKAARNCMLAMEWNAEVKAYELGRNLRAKHFNADHHLKGANAYILGLKWGWANRRDFESSPKRKLLTPRLLTQKELFAPLTKQEKQILKKFKGI
jgi:hypothetical protein